MSVLFFLLGALLGPAESYLSSGLLAISITRHHKGDVFVAQGGKCYKDFCVSLSSGTAAPTGNGDCECKCAANRPVFRDDVNTCVDDIRECNLVSFASGSVTKKIPYVFLPLKGQIVYPSADIVMSEEETPVCVVSGGQFLGQSGWLNLKNHSGTETPFRLFRDEGRTYLQWLGETTLRMAMEGRIILVHLMCKNGNAMEEPKIFTPCIGFRVAGNPSVKEMMFAADVHLKEEYGGGLSVREYVAIGVCSLLLAVVYVAAVALYLYIRKRKKKNGSKKSGKNATLTLGEEGVIKSNPLLQATRHLSSGGHDNGGYVSESNSCCSDTEQMSDLLCLDDDDDLVGPQNMQTAAIIHPCDLDYGETAVSQDPNNREKLPEENVSIVETLETREHPETVKGMGCGNGRRKLYFNPSYFEPDLLKAPPPAAMEFLIKIREVIAIAKHKMSAKKFSPSLLGIPEEDSTSKAECNSNLGARRNSTVTAAQPTDFPALPGEFCWPSDAKQKIIRKWLEDVPVMTLGEEDCKAQKVVSQESKILNKSKLWQMNEKNCEKESVPSPPLRQERRRTKGRAPPVPPLKASVPSESLGLEAVVPPRPPPMPASKHNSDEVPRVQGKDCVPPTIAKNLMDAVIQELTTFKKNENDSKLKDLPRKLNDTLQEAKENGKTEAKEKRKKDEEVKTPSKVEENGLPEEPEISKDKNATKSAPLDDHEYEIILLNPDQPVANDKGKQMKIYNLPQLFSKTDHSEGYSLVSEVYVNDGYSCCSGESPPSSFSNLSVDSDNVHYDVPNEKPGRLTIHVNDSPERYKTLPSDSDCFEPDTLDRKPKRARGVNGRQRKVDEGERYTNQKFHHSECYMVSSSSDKFTDSLERPHIMLKTNGTFKRNLLENNAEDLLRNFSWNKMEGFGSLREIYEAKSRNHRRETTSLIDCTHKDHDRISTLSWNEERRNKLLHRGIVLHINEKGSRRHKRTTRCDPCPADFPKGPFRFLKPSLSPHRSPSPTSLILSNRASPIPRYSPSPRTTSPPVPPPRSVPPSTPPRSTSSPSPTPQIQPRSTPSSPKPCASPLTRSPSLPARFPHLPSISPPLAPPPRPPKIVNSPLLPPRNTKPPIPPKNLRPPKPGKFASRPLPPLPHPSKNHSTSSPLPPRDPDALSILSGASMDSLNSSDYEAFYTLPYTDNEQTRVGCAPDPSKKQKPAAAAHRLCTRAQIPTDPLKPRPHRTEDSGYLSTDSDSCCPPIAFSAPFDKIPESAAQNSETDESLCDGASESGAESIATDSFFYGDFHSRPDRTSEDAENGEAPEGQQARPCALVISDVEVNSDTERHCVPITVRP